MALSFSVDDNPDIWLGGDIISTTTELKKRKKKSRVPPELRREGREPNENQSARGVVIRGRRAGSGRDKLHHPDIDISKQNKGGGGGGEGGPRPFLAFVQCVLLICVVPQNIPVTLQPMLSVSANVQVLLCKKTNKQTKRNKQLKARVPRTVKTSWKDSKI